MENEYASSEEDEPRKDELVVVRKAMEIIADASSVAREVREEALHDVIEGAFIGIGCILNDVEKFEREMSQVSVAEDEGKHAEVSDLRLQVRRTLLTTVRQKVISLHKPTEKSFIQNGRKLLASRDIANENHDRINAYQEEKRRKRGEPEKIETPQQESIVYVGKEEARIRLSKLENMREIFEIQRLHAEGNWERRKFHVLHESARLLKENVEAYLAFRDAAVKLSQVDAKIAAASNILDAAFRRIQASDDFEDKDYSEFI